MLYAWPCHTLREQLRACLVFGHIPYSHTARAGAQSPAWDPRCAFLCSHRVHIQISGNVVQQSSALPQCAPRVFQDHPSASAPLRPLWCGPHPHAMQTGSTWQLGHLTCCAQQFLSGCPLLCRGKQNSSQGVHLQEGCLDLLGHQRVVHNFNQNTRVKSESGRICKSSSME